MPRETYGRSGTFRTETHQLIDSIFAGDSDDNTSEVSVDWTGINHGVSVCIRKVRSTKRLIFKIGEIEHVVVYVSQIPGEDRILTNVGYVNISPNTRIVYTALSDAFNQKRFYLKGAYDCGNKYLLKHVSAGRKEKMAVLEANKILPYIFSQNSPLKGERTFDETYEHDAEDQEDHEENQVRRVIIVNAKEHGDLAAEIVVNSLVYIGGENHCPTDSMEQVQFQEFVKGQEPSGITAELFMGSPFPDTRYGGCRDGKNMLLCKMNDGIFLYWTTSMVPAEGSVVSEIAISELVDIFAPEEYDDEMTPFDRAWVMIGSQLYADTIHGVEDDVLDRLRCGFFEIPCPEVCGNVFFFKVQKRLLSAIRRLETMGPEIFGFTVREDGSYSCSIEKISEFLGVSTDDILSSIAEMGGIEKYFGGSISFLLVPYSGLPVFYIDQPVRVGKWAIGHIVRTKKGLFYIPRPDKYFMATVDGDETFLSEYNGPPILDDAPLNHTDLLSSNRY